MGVGTPEDILDSRGPRDRYVRLRPSHPARPQRLALHHLWPDQYQEQQVHQTISRRSIPNATAGAARTTPPRICATYISATRSSPSRLATYHNLYFYRTLMINIRQAIEQGKLTEFRREFLAKYRKHHASVHDEITRQENNNGKGHSYAGASPARPEG